MFSMCSELTPRAPIPDTRIPQLMQPWIYHYMMQPHQCGWMCRRRPPPLLSVSLTDLKEVGFLHPLDCFCCSLNQPPISEGRSETFFDEDRDGTVRTGILQLGDEYALCMQYGDQYVVIAVHAV